MIHWAPPIGTQPWCLDADDPTQTVSTRYAELTCPMCRTQHRIRAGYGLPTAPPRPIAAGSD